MNDFESGLKPGAFAAIVDGMAEAVWPNGTATVPSVVLGVPVK